MHDDGWKGLLGGRRRLVLRPWAWVGAASFLRVMEQRTTKPWKFLARSCLG